MLFLLAYVFCCFSCSFLGGIFLKVNEMFLVLNSFASEQTLYYFLKEKLSILFGLVQFSWIVNTTTFWKWTIVVHINKTCPVDMCFPQAFNKWDGKCIIKMKGSPFRQHFIFVFKPKEQQTKEFVVLVPLRKRLLLSSGKTAPKSKAVTKPVFLQDFSTFLSDKGDTMVAYHRGVT